jgi:imidazolonepropionase-like amidohydrolase
MPSSPARSTGSKSCSRAFTPQEELIGSIEIGELADLIVLDKNLFEIDPKAISDAKVMSTLFGGRVVDGHHPTLAGHTPGLAAEGTAWEIAQA